MVEALHERVLEMLGQRAAEGDDVVETAPQLELYYG
jgi:hypothetical protein